MGSSTSLLVHKRHGPQLRRPGRGHRESDGPRKVDAAREDAQVCCDHRRSGLDAGNSLVTASKRTIIADNTDGRGEPGDHDLQEEWA